MYTLKEPMLRGCVINTFYGISIIGTCTKEFLHVQGDHSIEVKLQNLPSGLFATKLQFTMEYLKSIDHNFQQDLKKELISVYS